MRLVQPSDVQFGTATLIAIVGLIVNIISALLLGHGHSDGHDHDDHDHTHAHHGDDNNLKSVYVHVIADALTSVLAIAALLAGRYLNWVWLDPLMGIVGAIVIARWAWSLTGVTAGVLLDQTDAQVASEIRELIEKPGDATITDLHVWRVGPQAHAAIVSVMGEGSASADSIRERLRPVHEVSHLTVEYRPA
jgi:cation diffusion facilitator family transporter